MATTRTMNAVYYNKPRDFTVKKVPVPQIEDDEVLVKVDISGVCGTDAHIHEGEFIAQFPLIPGHETIGTIVEIGKAVSTFKVGDRVAVDGSDVCGSCHFCEKGKDLFCENFRSSGVTRHGGFAEYAKYRTGKIFPIGDLTDEEASLVEPTSCAIHGMDRLQMPFGAKVLLIGAGPTGLVLAQLMKMGGAGEITVAANAGIKMDIAKQIEVADHYLELDRKDPEAQWKKLKEDNPYGFDVVAECTGVEKIVNDAIGYVGRGGTLLVYGVYDDAARVSWSPTKIFVDEIRVIGSFAQVYCFPRAVQLLKTRKIRTKGMVTNVYPLSGYQDALDMMATHKALKIALKPNMQS